MSMPALPEDLGGRLPSESERAAANQLTELLAALTANNAKLRVVVDETRKPTEIILTPGLSNMLMGLLRHVGRGDAVDLVPLPQMLSTQQAADILNVSRPFLISLLEKGSIEFTSVGRHRRIKAEHLFEYRRKLEERRSGALSELAVADGECVQVLHANPCTRFIDASPYPVRDRHRLFSQTASEHDTGRAVAAIRKMRDYFDRPKKTASATSLGSGGSGTNRERRCVASARSLALVKEILPQTDLGLIEREVDVAVALPTTHRRRQVGPIRHEDDVVSGSSALDVSEQLGTYPTEMAHKSIRAAHFTRYSWVARLQWERLLNCGRSTRK